MLLQRIFLEDTNNSRMKLPKIAKPRCFHYLFYWVAGIFFCSGINTAFAAFGCDTGFDRCKWSHDTSTALRWTPREGSGFNYVELTKCVSPNCGTATVKSPVLPPKTAETSVKFAYKIYGYSSVYLRLYLQTKDSNTKQMLFSKDGNYADAFPEDWTIKTVVVPAIDKEYQLFLKANTPYAEAMVAVKDVNMGGTNELLNEESNPSISRLPSSPKPERMSLPSGAQRPMPFF